MSVLVASPKALRALARALTGSTATTGHANPRSSRVRNSFPLRRHGEVILLQGSLGAGKTTFAGEFFRAAGHRSGTPVTSPTFVHMIEYALEQEKRHDESSFSASSARSSASPSSLDNSNTKQQPPTEGDTPHHGFHIDLYRAQSRTDLQRLQLRERVFASGIALVEWPERLMEFGPDLVPDEFLLLRIERLPKGLAASPYQSTSGLPPASEVEEANKWEPRVFKGHAVGKCWEERWAEAIRAVHEEC